MAPDLHATVADLLIRSGQRYTEGRRAIVDCLAAAARPMSLPEILRERPALPQSSVYRNLGGLEQAGVVQRLPGTDEFARFELSEELTSHHHHLVCERCGAVTDVAPSARLERTVERLVAEIAADTGFNAERHRLDVIGRCANCA